MSGGLVYDGHAIFGDGIWHEGTSLTLSGTACIEKNYLTILDGHNITIGTFTIDYVHIQIDKVISETIGKETTYTPTGGQFSTNGSEEYVSYFEPASGYTVEYNSDGKYMQLTGGAPTGNVCVNTTTGVEYETLEYAIDVVGSGETIKLLTNINLSTSVEVGSGKNFILDLDGYALHQTSYDARVLYINGGILSIKDSNSGSQTHYYSYSDGKWSLIDEETADVVSGGCISGGNVSGNGGGILLENQGILDFRGGTIAYNSAVTGGGVSDSFKPSFFGGTISHNTATLGGGVYMDGGYAIVGGDIKIVDNAGGNLATSNNLTLGTDKATPVDGMQVYVTKLDDKGASTTGQFTESCAESAFTIFYADESKCSVIYNKDGYYELTGEIPTPPTGNVCKNVDTQKEYATLEAAIGEVKSGETIQLLANIDLSAEIEIGYDKSFTLDLNDKVLKQTTNGKRIFVNNGYFTIVDNAAEKTTRYLSKISGVWELTDKETKYSVSGGCITGANTEGEVGAIWNGSGKLTLLGGNICGNKSTICGSGIFSVNDIPFEVGGTAVVNYNTGTNVSLIIDDNHFNYLTIGTGDNEPQNGMKIGVSVLSKGDGPGGYSQKTGRFTNTGIKNDYSQYFLADTPASFQVSFNEADGGYLELIDAPVVNVCQNVDQKKEYSTLEAAIDEVAADQTIQMLANTTAAGEIEISGKTFTLDLNGKDVSAADGCRLFLMHSDANMTITDSYVPVGDEEGGHINGSTIDTDGYDGSIIYNFGTLTINGGIFQNATSNGNGSDGAITNGDGSYFSMTGGVVRYCHSNGGFGGAVVIQEGNNAYISGGKFYENSSLLGGAIAIEAAGKGENGKLTISGGEIYNNYTTGDLAQFQNMGGAIGNQGDLTIYGGYIHDNYAGIAGGIGNQGNLNIGGTVKVSGNTANKAASNVTNAPGCKVTLYKPEDGMLVGVTQLNDKFVPADGQFSTNVEQETDAQYFFSDVDAYAVAYNAGTGEGGYLELVAASNVCMIVETKAEYPSIPSAIAAVESDQTIQMLKDINITSAIYVPAGTPRFALDLNGFVLKQAGNDRIMEISGGGMDKKEDPDNPGQYIYVPTDDAANVTIKDSKYGDQNCPHYFVQSDNTWTITDKETKEVVYGGVITGGNYTDGGAIANYGTLTVVNGNFCGNSAGDEGGAIAHEGLDSYIQGGTFSYNYAEDKGGAVIVMGAATGKLVITDGQFCHNKAGAFGGAVTTGAALEVSGGVFDNNTAGQCGGAIAIWPTEQVVLLTGGTFSNNTAAIGGGVGNLSEQTTIGGSLNVTGNKGGNFATTVPVALGTEKQAPADNMTIGIYLGDAKTYQPISGQFTTNGAADDVKYFTSDINTYSVEYDSKGGFLKLVEGTGPSAFELTITAAGYASLYYDHNLVVPDGVTKVCTYWYDETNNALVPNNILEAGSIIPANTGVVVFGAEGNYSFNFTDGEPKKAVESALTGVLEETKVDEIKGTIYAYGQPSDSNYKPAFYMISDKVLTIPQYKAYYIKELSKKAVAETKSIMIKED